MLRRPARLGLSVARNRPAATPLASGRALIEGGFSSANPAAPGTWLSAGETYDPSTGLWSLVASMSASRRGHTAGLLPSGQVLVAGGSDEMGYLATAEADDPVADTWTLTVSMSTPRAGHTATPFASAAVLVVGGADGGALASAELLNARATK
jgi:hypothetical protein